MILLIGFSSEGTIRHVADRLQQKGLDFQFLDLGRLKDCRTVMISGDAYDLVIRLDTDEFDFSKYSAFYTRGYFHDLGSAQRNKALSDCLNWISHYLESAEAIVINRPSAAAGNANKLLQIHNLRDCGFSVPEAFLIGCETQAKRLISPDEHWIAKSCSGIKTRVEVVRKSDIPNFSLLKNAPVQFQRRIIGADVRVHIVGDYVFSLKIESPVTDYRFAGQEDKTNEFSRVEIPTPELLACREYCNKERLIFGGFDFKVDQGTGEWIVLECNPMPGFEYFDRRLDGEISEALCNVLESEPSIPAKEKEEHRLFISNDRRPKMSPFS